MSVLPLFVIDGLSKVNQGVRVACILGWGPRRWRGPDSIRLAGDHAQGVTPFRRLEETFCEVIILVEYKLPNEPFQGKTGLAEDQGEG